MGFFVLARHHWHYSAVGFLHTGKLEFLLRILYNGEFWSGVF